MWAYKEIMRCSNPLFLPGGYTENRGVEKEILSSAAAIVTYTFLPEYSSIERHRNDTEHRNKKNVNKAWDLINLIHIHLQQANLLSLTFCISPLTIKWLIYFRTPTSSFIFT